MQKIYNLSKKTKITIIVSLIISSVIISIGISFHNEKVKSSTNNNQTLIQEKMEGFYVNDVFQHTTIFLTLDEHGNAEMCYGGNCSYPTYTNANPNTIEFSDNNNYFTNCSKTCSYPDATEQKAEGLICTTSFGKKYFLPKTKVAITSNEDGFSRYIRFNANPQYEECNENNINEESNNSSEEDEISNDKIKKIYNSISIHIDSLEDWYFYQNKEVTLKNISNKQKILLAYHNLPESSFSKMEIKSQDGDYIDEMKTFNVNDLENSMKKILGNDVKYDDESFSTFACGGFEYYKNNQKYVSYGGGCGDTLEGLNLHTSFYKSEEHRDKIVIYEKFGFIDTKMSYSSTLENEYSLYKDADKKNLIKKSTKEIDINNHIEELNMVKYTFKKDQDNYYFYSSEIVNS